MEKPHKYYDSEEIRAKDLKKLETLQALDFQILQLNNELLNPNTSEEEKAELNEKIFTLTVEYNNLITKNYTQENTSKLYEINKN